MIKLIQITIAFIVIGLLVFVSLATFDTPTYESEIWGHSYAVWNKTSFVLICYLAWKLSVKRYGNILRPVFWIMVIRLVWDIVAWIGGWQINNMWVVSSLFLIFIFYAGIKAIQDARN